MRKSYGDKPKRTKKAKSTTRGAKPKKPSLAQIAKKGGWGMKKKG